MLSRRPWLFPRLFHQRAGARRAPIPRARRSRKPSPRAAPPRADRRSWTWRPTPVARRGADRPADGWQGRPLAGIREQQELQQHAEAAADLHRLVDDRKGAAVSIPSYRRVLASWLIKYY